MDCPKCRRANPADAAFCDECGVRLEAACPACGAGNRLDARFCRRCGAPLAAASPPAAALGGEPPKHLAEKILTSREALEGERKQVTILFADVKGSMELLEGRDPEEARRLLDPALQAMMEAVHRYEGTVNQVLGDGIMALFGAPLAHEDHALRACYAALAMQEAIARYTETLRRAHGVEIRIRVGINSGEVVVRAIGSDLRMDYSAVGPTTHLAARMEQLATPATTRLTENTRRLVEGFIQVRALGPIPVKGMPAPVPVYELTGVTPVRTRLQAAAARGLTPFVGRQAELAILDGALARARDGHGHVVALVGEPGVGKSRLFWEFTRSPRTQGWLILESSAVPYGKATPYLPVIDLLEAYFRIEDRDDARARREKITGKLLALDEQLRPAVAAFLTLFDVPCEDHEWQALDPLQRRRRRLEALRRLLLRESGERPLLLVLEDLHWIDSETQACLDALIESLPAARILLLVNYRPEYQHAWGGRSSYTQVRIDPLPTTGAEALLETLLGGEAGLAPLKRLLVERTEGNPFFLEETVRMLDETGALAGEPGAYRLVHSLGGIRVPATVQALLAARIDRLPPDEKRLLQAAAVVGRDVPRPLLQAVADLAAERLSSALADLQKAEFLYEANLFPEIQYTFRHAVTHEVAYASLLAERRRALHATIVEAIERLYPERRAEQIERLAHHAFHGELWDRAVHYQSQAGTLAFERAANREAAACFERALAALGRRPESPEALGAAIDLRFDLRNALFPLGEHQRIGECLGEARALAEALGDEPRLGRACSYLVNHCLAVGDHQGAIAAGEQALALAERLADHRLRTSTLFHLGQLYASLGDYRRAAALNRRTVESVEGEPGERGQESGLAVLSHTWLVWCLSEAGEFAEALERGAARVRAAEAGAGPFERVTAYLGAGLARLRRGDLPEATEILERALAQCRGGGLEVWFPAVASPLGYAYALSGRPTEAIPLLEEAVAETTSRRGAGHALRLAHLAEAYLIAGRVEEARTLAGRALDLAVERRERGHEAYALRLAAEVAGREEPADACRVATAYRRALALAEELGMGPLAARCRLGLGLLYRGRGDVAAARAELGAAVDLFRSMGMTVPLARAEAELAGTATA